MNDIARKVTERLYGDDKVKFEIILNMLIYEQMNHEFTRRLSECYLDEYIIGLIEHLEDTFDKEEIEKRHNSVREHANCIPIRESNKLIECLKDENMLYLSDIEKMDKNSVKKRLNVL